jgi:hypothetical protein
MDVRDVTSDRATRSLVTMAPGVSLAFGVPVATGSLQNRAIYIEQDVASPVEGVVIRQDAAELFRGYNSAGDVIVELAQGGTGAVRLPFGLVSERPAGTRGMIRVRADDDAEVIEHFDAIKEKWAPVQSVVENGLSGTVSGPATVVPLEFAGRPVGLFGAIPISSDRTATRIGISVRHGSSPGVGTWTATLHRIRDGSSSAVATFDMEL